MTVRISDRHSKNPDIMKVSILLEDGLNEDKADVTIDTVKIYRPSILGMMVILIAGFGLLTLFLLLLFPHVEGKPKIEYVGFCGVPLDDIADMRQLVFVKDVEIETTTTEATTIDPDEMRVIKSNNEQQAGQAIIRYLSEQLNIRDHIEKIYVAGGLGKLTNFVHDWAANVSGIIETDRCFVMDMDRKLVLPPPVFVLSIKKGGQFEVSRVRSAFAAALPALTNLTRFGTFIAQECKSRPTYRLEKIDTIVSVQKRSVEDPQPDFIHFSGKHVHEIDVVNKPQIDEYEGKNQSGA